MNKLWFVPALLFCAAAQAAPTPAGGELNESVGPLVFSGGPFTVPNPTSDGFYLGGSEPADTPVVCSAVLMNCDVYALTVTVPEKFRSTRTGKNAVVRFVISFSVDQPASQVNDLASFDVYLYDANDAQVAKGDAGFSGTGNSAGFELPLSALPNGLYQVRVTANRGMGGSYTAEIGLEPAPKLGTAGRSGSGILTGAVSPLMLLGLLLATVCGRVGFCRVLVMSAGMAFCATSLAATPVPVPGILSLPAPDIGATLAADAARPAPKPYRFGVSIPGLVTPLTHGRWQTLSDGTRLWQLRVEATGARSLNFGFTRFQIPDGAELRVSRPDGRDRHGPYLARHATAGQLWTPPVNGATAIIELRLPAAARDVGLELTQVNYGFRSFNNEETDPKALPCNIDVACPQGDEWRNEIRAVARILVSGVYACSGTMLNNTAQDFRPYFLTANHCFDASGAEAASVVALWNYQKNKCGGDPNPAGGGLLGDNSGNNQTGATMRANAIYRSPGVEFVMNAQPDFALLELSQRPPPEFQVYYSGWDRRDLAPVGVIGIHHPQAQDKSLSLTAAPAVIGDVEGAPDEALGSFNYFLKLAGWEQGSTQSGSSGSGLWNREHRLVANDTGGVPQDSCPHTGEIIYFRFYSAWNHAELPTRMLPPYLDPANSGVEVLDGADPNGIDLRQPGKPSSQIVGATKSGKGLFLGASTPPMLLGLLLAALAGATRLRRFLASKH